MKRFAAPILIAVIVAVGGYKVHSNLSARVEVSEKEASMLRIQRDYLERVSYVRSIADAKAYREEVNTLFRWYFKEIAEYQKRFQTNPEFDDYLNELESRGGKDAQVAERQAYFKYVKKTFDSMLAGNYAPVWTGTANGLRLDVISTDVLMVAGSPKIRMQMALWGAQRELRTDGKMKKMVTSSSFSSKWKLTGAKIKYPYEMEISGDPNMKVDWPERFIAEFPSQMVLGHYDMDLIPSDVDNAEISFTVSTRALTGGEAVAALEWKLPVPSEWKLKEGEKWEGATISERSEDELNPSAKK